jgi:DNA-binding MarR family transcriptional regulator
MAHTLPGHRFAELAALCLRINGALTRAGDALVDDIGLTSARWQVLGSIHRRPTTVPRLARRLGLRRQSVQRSVDRLVADGMVRLEPNPHHRSSPLVTPTDRGHRVLAEARSRYEAWADRMGRDLDADEMAAACRVLGELADRFVDEVSSPPAPRRATLGPWDGSQPGSG